MKYLMYILALCLTAQTAAAVEPTSLPARIDSIAIEGADPVSPETCRRLLLSSPGGVLNEGLLDHDRNALQTFFRERGWWRAEVTSGVDSSGSGVVVTFTVVKGTPAILGTVRVTGMPDEPRNLPPIEPGSQFDSGILTEIVRGITSQSVQDGYPGTRIRPVLSARGDTIDVTLEIEPGVQAIIDSFAVTGLTRTRDETVIRELTPLRKRAADTQAVAEAREIIRSIGFVTLAADPEIVYPPGQPATLALRLEEGPQGVFDGIIGYQPDANGGGEMVGTVDLSLWNLAGTARNAAVHWQNLGKGTGDLTVRYREPWLFDLPYAFEGAFSQERRDRLAYTKTALQLSVNRSFGGIEVGGGYRYEKISADSLASSSAHGIDLSVRWTALDNPLNPRSGFQYRAAWTNLAKSYRFGARKSHAIERAEFDMDQFIPTVPGQTLAFLFRYRRVTAPASSLTAADRYWLGGAASIRGYRELVFPAVEAAWANVEYRFLQSEQSRVFVFLDYGHIIDRERAAGALRTTRLDRTGWGFGLRTAARVGTLGFDYALGAGDSWMNGKLHVSLSNSF